MPRRHFLACVTAGPLPGDGVYLEVYRPWRRRRAPSAGNLGQVSLATDMVVADGIGTETPG